MQTKTTLAKVSLCPAALVGLAGVSYYISHQYRPGASPHLIALSVAICLLAIAQIQGSRKS